MIQFKGYDFELVNSTFKNAHASTSGGAILAKYFAKDGIDGGHVATAPFLISGCNFTNMSCGNDGGAMHFDLDSGSEFIPKTMNIISSNFTVIGGNVNIRNSAFTNNLAGFEGGAIYSSWTNLNITESTFKDNNAEITAGALYFDKGRLTLTKSNLTDNKAHKESSTSANAIYAHDAVINFSNSTFNNGGVAVYADFSDNSVISNVDKNNDIFLMDNHNYIVSVENKGIKLNFTNNKIIVDKLPSHFDARDWGWTTPGKMQGDNDDCWAFATVASLETALGKATGTLYNLSQNYVQTLQLKYFEVGDLRISLTGFSYSGLGYALSWYGILPADDVYDDRGMISDADNNLERIHLQDARFIYTGQNNTIEELKKAIINYGAVTVQYWITEPPGTLPTEGDDIAIEEHGTHFITLVGWEDKSNSNESLGSYWICKDSIGEADYHPVSFDTFNITDYYAIVPQKVAVAYIIYL